jgi:hypothetical protein
MKTVVLLFQIILYRKLTSEMFNPIKQRRKEKLKSSVSDEVVVRIITISKDCPVSQQHKT